jgi:hypothetical protein
MSIENTKQPSHPAAFTATIKVAFKAAVKATQQGTHSYSYKATNHSTISTTKQ